MKGDKRMAKYIAKRVALAIVTLLVLTSVVFVLVRLMPGDPFMSEKASEENRAILIAKYGLDQPVYVQYGKYLENLVKERIGVKVRSIELNVCQRCSSEYLSATDLNESENAGIVGVQAALKGETGKMITFIRNCDLPYELSYETADVNEICNMEKAVPSDWITEDGCDVTEAFIQYARPLIQGKVVLPEENGLPLFAYRK